MKNSLAHFHFPTIRDISHTHYLITHSSHSFFFSSYMFIILLSIVMMNRNVIWHQFLHILFSHDIRTWFAHPYGFMSYRSMEFLPLYKAFTLSVQGKYGKCTRVYKGTCLEGFQMILRNSLAHFLFPSMRDIPHTYWFIMCNPCILFYCVHVHSISYPTNDKYEMKLGSNFPSFR